MNTSAPSVTKPVMRRGTRVETTGQGRTRRWAGWVGTVVRVSHDRIYVQMDYARATEEFESAEIRLLDRHSGCPCAIHHHS